MKKMIDELWDGEISPQDTLISDNQEYRELQHRQSKNKAELLEALSDEQKELLEKFLLQTVSFHDVANETFYHGLILGLCAMLNNQYRLTSNREAGNGRFDIQMLPLNKLLPGILIELKAGKDCTEEQLSRLADAALKQINDKQYDADMVAQGVTEILQYGIAFSGKKACVRAEEVRL